MGLLNGSATYQQYLVLGQTPSEEALDKGLIEHQIRPFQDGSEVERVGFCHWQNSLLAPEAGLSLLDGGRALVAVLIETRKVPAKILKAHVDLKIRSYQKEKNAAFIGKDLRQMFKDEVQAALINKYPPAQKTIEAIWDIKNGRLLTGATSTKAEGALRTMMFKAFGVELQAMLPAHRASAAGIAVGDIEAVVAMDLEVK